MRACSKCATEKPLAEYGKYSRYEDGLSRRCKACTREHNRLWRKNNPAKAEEVKNNALAKRREQAAVRIAARAAERAAGAEAAKVARDERRRELARARYAENPEKGRQKCKQARYADPERAAEWKRRHRAKYKDSVPHLLASRMRARLNKALQRRKAGRSWMALVDYSVPELIAHLERQFLKGMSWENMGEWHVDHIVPLASFDLTCTDSPEFRRAWCLTNLRPLWASENISKGARVTSLL